VSVKPFSKETIKENEVKKQINTQRQRIKHANKLIENYLGEEEGKKR
jgi:hypothetical protein